MIQAGKSKLIFKQISDLSFQDVEYMSFGILINYQRLEEQNRVWLV